MKAFLALFALIVVVAGQGQGRPPFFGGGRRSSEDSRDSREIFPRNNFQINFNGIGQIRGFACSTAASFTTSIDGTTTTARCTDNGADPSVRCPGCCRSVALAAGRSADNAAGFPSTNGRSCVCCIR
ncbi:Protein CBG15758 [Caenorhabditis briggsae]|uniref:Uncharacterized protein n=2 Tax=Caenorhabditis briggsae TaxID=6238 RepID=A0AAE9EJR1_CAEBR|nr:Protein CBG15758 [Caenorhabditis briggsae]ULT98798.1 hypothetical protein L3Y34_000274 [Caenorhabditis briggsae]UMM21483.1 hypothetical protein L5515_003147 [Caenorhabditis briggsae]CAP33930.1 Protein CBG15758 [Caenorhabditis briggsae]